MKALPNRNSRETRRGAALVEFSLVAIPLFLCFFASIEVCRVLMATQSMDEAARAGCRKAVLHGATEEIVGAEIEELMSVAGIQQYDFLIHPANFETLDRWEPVTVIITTDFENIGWLPTPMYFSEITFQSASTLPKECSSNL